MKEYLLIQVAATAAIGIACVADSSGDDDVCSLRAAPKKKGVFKMMDVLMVGTLAVSSAWYGCCSC